MVADSISDIGSKDLTVEAAASLVAQIWQWLESVCDPEVPVLSVLDLGVVRSVTISTANYEIKSVVESIPNGQPPMTIDQRPLANAKPPIIKIQITPTYTGCPAMNMIAANIKIELLANGIENVQVEEVLSPAWTTDWLSEAGKKKLLEYGIAPPMAKARMDKMLFSDIAVPCPQCGSENTERISEFGSTACKSLHRCLDCREPFDYFKCH